MENFEIKDYLPTIHVVITALSTLLAVIITNHFNSKASQRNLEAANKQRLTDTKLNKLEELYLLFGKWEAHLSSVYLHHLRVYTGRLNYNQLLDLIKDLDMLIPGEAQKIKMLLNIHFLELLADYQKVDEARALIAPYIVSSPKENNLSVNDFIDAQKTFEKACKIFKEKVSAFARSNS